MSDALYSASRSFLTSAITVTLCCLWPTLINTAVGVSSMDRDLVNVGKVLRLGWFTTVWKIALPSAMPMIFTGLRLSLGIGWMVLIAAEMLAQNPARLLREIQHRALESGEPALLASTALGELPAWID